MWRFVLTDQNYYPIGEILNAQDRQVTLPLNKLDTLSFKVRLDNPLSSLLASCAGFIKAYRNNVLIFFGPIISTEEVCDSSTQSLAIVAAGAGWVLTKRLAGKNASGVAYPGIDRVLVADAAIQAADLESTTGISGTSDLTLSGSLINYTIGPFRPVSEVITELATTLDGFDWRFIPIENTSLTGNARIFVQQSVAQFVAAPLIGQERPNAVFEWGSNSAANCVSYRRTLSRDAQATRVWNNTANGPDAPGYPTVYGFDEDAQEQWGLLEDLVEAPDLLDISMRQALVNEHVRVRKNPRQLIDIQPASSSSSRRAPDFGVDFTVGDRVRGRAVYGRGVRFDAALRVWAAMFDIDAAGTERITLTLSEE